MFTQSIPEYHVTVFSKFIISLLLSHQALKFCNTLLIFWHTSSRPASETTIVVTSAYAKYPALTYVFR